MRSTSFVTPAARILARSWPLVPLLALFLYTDFRGVDFGEHWDEAAWQLGPVQEMVQTGLYMPRAAIYPALAKWLTLLPALWNGLLALFHDGPGLQTAITEAISAPTYLLTVRRLFIVVSSFSIAWVYAAALVLRLRVWQATVAAATLALSWEFAYHSRFVATDCIGVQFCALTLLLLVAFLRSRRRSLLYGAAVTTGLAIGTKFPAAPLLLPVLAVGASSFSPYEVRAQLRRACALSLIAVVTYLVTTPATLFDPFEFVHLLQYISARYQKGHYGYTVGLGWDHLYRVMLYFGLSYFSPYRIVSSVLALGVLAGIPIWWQRDRKVGLLLVGFPIVFLIFFCFRYAALLVRNYLLLAPFFALLLAGALGSLVARLPRALGFVVFAALLAVGVANGAYLVSAAESIRTATAEDDVRQALEYVAKKPDSRYRLSPRVKDIAVSKHFAVPANVGRHGDHIVFFAPDEGPNPFDWPANDPFAVERTFGPRDVNFDWYPTWTGSRRVVVMPRDKALEIGLPLLGR
jgi:hypothetical protein